MARRSKTAGITTDGAGNKTIDKICLKERVFARLGPVSQQQAEEYLATRIKQFVGESYTESVLKRLSEKQRSGI